MTIVSIQNGEHYRWGTSCEGWHLLKSPGLSVIQERVPPGHGEIRHYHKLAEQFFFVLTGTASMEIDTQNHNVQAGQGIYVAAGTPHRLHNAHSTELLFLVITSPPGQTDRVNA